MGNVLQRIKEEFMELLSFYNFRKLLTYTLIVTNAFYFTSLKYSDINLENPYKVFENYLILKFIAVSIAVNLVFYRIPRFFLRIYFHGYIRNWFLKKRQEIEAKGRFTMLKHMHSVYTALKFLIKNYIYQLGYVNRLDLSFEIEINQDVKEEMLNEALKDCYGWICSMIHFIITLCFIWNYVNVWLILIAIILLIVNFLTPFIAIPVVMNIEILNKIRLDIVKDKHLGNRPIELPK